MDKRDNYLYLGLTSPTDVLEFQKGYSKFLEEKKGNPNLGNGIGPGLVAGIVLGFCSLIPSIETYEEVKEALTELPINEISSRVTDVISYNSFAAETSLLVAVSVPIVIGGIVEYINSRNWKKDHEKNDRELRERYLVADKKYATGKNAVASALSSS